MMAMSEEIKAAATFEPPDLWGIDPDEIWPWTPRAGRVLVSPGVWNKERKNWDELPTYGDPLPGAPVFDVGPMEERLALKVYAARQRIQTVQNRILLKELEAGSDIDKASEKAVDASIAQDIYSDALVAEVLSSTVKGWRGLRSSKKKEIPFTGDWKKDGIAMRPAFQIELFRDIVSETLFEGEGQKDSFTSSPDSAAG
jgi:hypothetical protein